MRYFEYKLPSWKRFKYAKMFNRHLTDKKIRYYVEKIGKKDPKSKNLTAKDRQLARSAFYQQFMASLENNEYIANAIMAHMSEREYTAKKIANSTLFTSPAETDKRNMARTLKEYADINLKWTSLEYNSTAGMYEITTGKYGGNYIEIRRSPSSENSVEFALVPILS